MMRQIVLENERMRKPTYSTSGIPFRITDPRLNWQRAGLVAGLVASLASMAFRTLIADSNKHNNVLTFAKAHSQSLKHQPRRMQAPHGSCVHPTALGVPPASMLSSLQLHSPGNNEAARLILARKRIVILRVCEWLLHLVPWCPSLLPRPPVSSPC